MRKSTAEKIKSTVNFRLPFKVYDFIGDRHFLDWRDMATRLVYFDLHVIEDQSYEKGSASEVLSVG